MQGEGRRQLGLRWTEAKDRRGGKAGCCCVLLCGSWPFRSPFLLSLSLAAFPSRPYSRPWPSVQTMFPRCMSQPLFQNAGQCWSGPVVWERNEKGVMVDRQTQGCETGGG